METSIKTERQQPKSYFYSENDKELIFKSNPAKREAAKQAKQPFFSQEMTNSNSTMRKRGRGQNKRFWTTQEDSALLESLQELYHKTTWRDDNGFKNGYLAHIEGMLEAKLPGCGIQASPHIESRVKTLKKKYCALSEMLSHSGFGWDNEQMMLVCNRSEYDEWVKMRKEPSGLYGKPFPFYHILGEIYGRGRPIGVSVGNADDSKEENRLVVANVDQNLGADDAFGENVNLHVDTNTESEFEGMEDFDVSFSAKQDRSTQSTPSVSIDGRKVKAKVMEEITKSFGIIAASVEAMTSQIAALINSLSTDKEVAELQGKLAGELGKIEGLTQLQVFRAINILAKSHDLLRVFFSMPEERKKLYVTYLLEHGS